jgi:hypothetical protein
MTGKTKKTFEHLLTTEQTTARGLLERAAKIAELDNLVQQCLPTPLAGHCQVVNVRNSKLILKLDSPAWATQVRFNSASLLSTLRQNPNFAGLAGIDFYVKPDITSEEKTVKAIAKRPALSAKAKQALLNTAATISNPQLRAVLEKIAAR